MLIKIALICSQAYKEYISSIAQTITDFQIDFYIYEQPDEANALLDELKPADVLVIGGLLPYLTVEKRLKNWQTPHYYLEQDESSVATTLLATITRHQTSLSRISIDVIKPEFVNNIIEDIAYEDDAPFIQLSTSPQLLKAHETLFKEGLVDYIITSVHHVYKQLQEMNIPTIRMIDSKSALLQKLSDIKSMALLNKSDANRAAAGVIELHVDDEEAFFQLTREIHASYKKIEGMGYEIYTTSGRLQYLLSSERLTHILNDFKKPFALGFGYGETIVEALNHANEALRFSIDNQVFLLNEQSKLTGPYPKGATSLLLKVDHPKLMEIAHRTKLSPLNLSKIIAFSDSRQSHQFTAHDLADYLFVTRRTAERTIKKLVDHEYASSVAEEMTYQKGRPRAVYALNFTLKV